MIIPGKPVVNLSMRLNSTLIEDATDLQLLFPVANVCSCLKITIKDWKYGSAFWFDYFDIYDF